MRMIRERNKNILKQHDSPSVCIIATHRAARMMIFITIAALLPRTGHNVRMRLGYASGVVNVCGVLCALARLALLSQDEAIRMLSACPLTTCSFSLCSAPRNVVCD